MLKGVVLSVSIAVFVTSLIFFISGLSGVLTENIFTGAVIGASGVVNYSIIGMFLSAISGSLIILSMRKFI